MTDRGAVTAHNSGYGTGYTTRGNVTTVRQRLLSENRNIDTHSTYDTVGNVVQTLDPKNNSTTIAYSSSFHFAYPTTVTNAKGHQAQTNYNIYTGVVATATDANGQTSSFQYDAYNRVTQQMHPTAAGSNTFTATAIFRGSTGPT